MSKINWTETIDGTDKAGFVGGGENPPPRECGHCRWQSEGLCHHSEVMADPDTEKNEQGFVKVDSDDCCNHYQVAPLVVFFRHGETTVNKANQFRGFLNVELDETGIQEAKEAGELVKYLDFGAFYCSDLLRAVQTLNEVRGANLFSKDVVTEITPRGRPWNVGVFSGEDKTDENKSLLKEFSDNPDIPIPGGESLNEFREKFSALFQKALAKSRELKKPVGIFGHASNGHEIGNIIYNDIDSLDTDPGGVIIVYERSGKLEGQVIKNEPTNAHGYGSS